MRRSAKPGKRHGDDFPSALNIYVLQRPRLLFVMICAVQQPRPEVHQQATQRILLIHGAILRMVRQRSRLCDIIITVYNPATSLEQPQAAVERDGAFGFPLPEPNGSVRHRKTSAAST
jgi:hypothetical protein